MNLEEAFGISVEEESSQNITTVQEAADLIEKLVQSKAEAQTQMECKEGRSFEMARLDYFEFGPIFSCFLVDSLEIRFE